MGLVASITGLPARLAAPAALSASSATVPLTASTTSFAELGGVGKAAGLRALMLRDEVLELAGIARAEHDLMPMLDKAAGQRFGHVARS